MAASGKVFSLHGQGLKLDTRADIAPHLEGVDPKVIEEIHLGGNTIGIEAAQAFAEFLEKTEVLKVRAFIRSCFTYSNLSSVTPLSPSHRSQTSPTSSLAV